MQALHPFERGVVWFKKHQQFQKVGLLQGAMHSLQPIGAFRVPGARIMQQVALIKNIAGTAH